MRKRTIAVAAILALVVAIASIAFLRDSLDPLTLESLTSAREEWKRAGIRNYDMTLVLNGFPYEVKVRGAIVMEVSRDGEPTTSHRSEDFSIDGAFDTLEQELELFDDPANPFGGDRATTFLQVRFHSTLGYVERYLRTVGGTGRSSTFEIRRFSTVGQATGA